MFGDKNVHLSFFFVVVLEKLSSTSAAIENDAAGAGNQSVEQQLEAISEKLDNLYELTEKFACR